jgi:hypothetical protein
VEPEAALVGAGRALLVGVRLDKGGVQVDPQRPCRGRAKRPGTLADPGQRRPQPGDPTRVSGQFLGQDAPGGRGRGDLAEQRRLVPECGQVADTVATVGEHHHQVAQHLAAVIRASTHAEVGAAAKLTGQSQPVGQLPKQRCTDVAADALAVGDDFESGTGVGSLHRQGDPPGGWLRPSDSRILPGREGPLLPGSSVLSPHAK